MTYKCTSDTYYTHKCQLIHQTHITHKLKHVNSVWGETTRSRTQGSEGSLDPQDQNCPLFVTKFNVHITNLHVREMYMYTLEKCTVLYTLEKCIKKDL